MKMFREKKNKDANGNVERIRIHVKEIIEDGIIINKEKDVYFIHFTFIIYT